MADKFSEWLKSVTVGEGEKLTDKHLQEFGAADIVVLLRKAFEAGAKSKGG